PVRAPVSVLRCCAFVMCHCAHAALHSFPTRRSSDLSLITPADVASTLILMGPMLLLYELGIGLVRMVERRRAKREVESDRYWVRSEEHTSELQSRENLVCRLLLEKKNETPPPRRSVD